MAHFKILSRILNRLDTLGEPSDGFVSVELGDDFIKIAETSVLGGSPQVSRLLKRPLNVKDKEAAVEGIKSVFGSLNIPHRRVRLNIPRHLVIVRLLKLPSVNDDEIKVMVKMESLKYVLYADENIVSGHRIVEKYPDGYSSVLVAVAQAETVQEFTSLFNKAGFTVESVSLGSESLLLWYLRQGLLDKDKTVLLLNADLEHIGIDVVAQNKLVFTRGVSYVPGADIPDEKIIQEIKVSMVAYQKESRKTIDKIFLSGITEKINRLRDVFRINFTIPVDIIDQMHRIEKTNQATLELTNASFVELLGLSLGFAESKINLLPESAQDSNRLERIKKRIILTLAIFGLTLAVIFCLVLKKFHDEKATVQRVDKEFQTMGPDLKDAKKMARQIEIVTAKLTEKPLAIDLLSEIYNLTPPGISLALMECETDKSMTLRGSAPSLSEVFKYVVLLQKSPLFNNVKVKYANKRAGQITDLADFEIVASVSKTKETKKASHVDKKPK